MNTMQGDDNSYNDLIAITVRQYKFFMSNGSDGINGLLLYSFFIYAARLQVEKVNDAFIRKSLSWGAEKTRRTKNWLAQNGFITYGEDYITVKFPY